jgi:diacylglycerol kinase (ATP)
MKRASGEGVLDAAVAREFSVATRLRSFVYAGRGVLTMVRSQHNAWIHGAATLSVVAAGFACGLERFEWLALVFAIVSVWAAESLNTAFEFLCDVAAPDFHPLVARAKDVAAAAVLICAVGAVLIGAVVFAPHVVAAVRGAIEIGSVARPRPPPTPPAVLTLRAAPENRKIRIGTGNPGPEPDPATGDRDVIRDG